MYSYSALMLSNEEAIYRNLRVGHGIEALYSAKERAAVVATACVDLATQGCHSQPTSLVQHWHLGIGPVLKFYSH